MKNVIRFLAVIAVAMLFVGCASDRGYYAASPEPQVTPEPGKALVWFYRSTAYAGAVKAVVYDWDEFVGFVPYGYKVAYQADPGEHTFMIVGESADFCGAELLEGEIYHIKVSPRLGAWSARFSLDPVEKETYANPDFTEWVANAKIAEPVEKSYAWVEKNAANIEKKRISYHEVWLTKENRPFLAPEDHQ